MRGNMFLLGPLVIILILVLAAPGCGSKKDSNPKVVSMSVKDSLMVRMGGSSAVPKYSSVYAPKGHDLLVIVFETGVEQGPPPRVSLTDTKGKEYKSAGTTWNKNMGSKIKQWWHIPNGETKFILIFQGKSYPIDT